MPRRKPTKKLDVCGKLEMKPEAAVGDFLDSKTQEGFFVKPPNWDSAGDTIQLLAIENVHEHESMVRLQGEMLENATRQKESNARRIKKLYNTHSYLRKQFIDVNAFVKECEEKKQKTLKDIDKEQARQIELGEKIEKYKEAIGVLTEFRKKLKTTVKEYQPYERVAEEVVAKSDLFESVKDSMDRCDALMLAQMEIFKLNEQKIQQIEDIRNSMSKLIHEVALTMLGLKNDLNELERSYNEARDECIKWERILAGAKDNVRQNDQNKNRCLDVIQMMYRMFCRRRSMDPNLQRHEVDKQLDFVKGEIEILNEVVLVCEARQAKKSGVTSRRTNTHKC